MKFELRVSLAVPILLSLACAPAASPASQATSQPEPGVYAFVGVNVLPMTDGQQMLADQTVVVRGERIVSAGPRGSVEIPAEATRIDAQNQYLLPGLAEMHGHIPPPSAPQQYVSDVLFLYVANGITTVRGMLGWPGQLELRERVNRGEVLSPTLYLAGPSFSGQSIGSPEQAVARVEQQKQEGWDLLKIHPGLTLQEYDAMADAAHRLEIRFGGHVPEEVGLMHALESRQETFDHLDGYIEYLQGDRPLAQEALVEVARKTREAGAWVVPTMALWETLLGVADLEELEQYPELKYMPSDQVERWREAAAARARDAQSEMEGRRQVAENRKKLLKVLNDEGVQILMGTDAPQIFSVPGFSLRHELAVMTDSGLTPHDILVSGTRNVGRYFKDQDAFGTVQPGMRADLLLVSANPLENIENIFRQTGVMVRGRWLPAEEIAKRLDAIAAR